VVHGGGSMAGEYLHSLVATDVCSGWVEAVPLLAREQTLAVAGLMRIREQMPVTTLGIDSDNDGAFINETVASYCQTEGLAFTRSRPHHKNDQSWIEQKNGAVIRRMVGHERFSGIVAGQALAQLLAAVRLYVNFFQPSFKLRERIRAGARVKKRITRRPRPATGCWRTRESRNTSRRRYWTQRDRLDPLELLQRIRQGQAALAALSTGEPSAGPDRKGLDHFLASLPDLWREGEARPTHRKGEAKTRHWRTREDPFKDVWTDILLWLQKEPDTIAKVILHKLDEKYPGKFDDKLLRTLQRRVGEWWRSATKCRPSQDRPRSGSLRSPPRGLPHMCLKCLGQPAAAREKAASYQALSLVTISNEATGGGRIIVVEHLPLEVRGSSDEKLDFVLGEHVPLPAFVPGQVNGPDGIAGQDAEKFRASERRLEGLHVYDGCLQRHARVQPRVENPSTSAGETEVTGRLALMPSSHPWRYFSTEGTLRVSPVTFSKTSLRTRRPCSGQVATPVRSRPSQPTGYRRVVRPLSLRQVDRVRLEPNREQLRHL
jgi:hypothetical protein